MGREDPIKFDIFLFIYFFLFLLLSGIGLFCWGGGRNFFNFYFARGFFLATYILTLEGTFVLN